MKIRRYHVSKFGLFGGGVVADADGYVTYHDSPRYAAATDEQLKDWAANAKTLAARNAARTEINKRRLNEWRD